MRISTTKIYYICTKKYKYSKTIFFFFKKRDFMCLESVEALKNNLTFSLLTAGYIGSVNNQVVQSQHAGMQRLLASRVLALLVRLLLRV